MSERPSRPPPLPPNTANKAATTTTAQEPSTPTSATARGAQPPSPASARPKHSSQNSISLSSSSARSGNHFAPMFVSSSGQFVAAPRSAAASSAVPIASSSAAAGSTQQPPPPVFVHQLPIPPLLRTWHVLALKALHKRPNTLTLNLLECSLSFDKTAGGGARHKEFGLLHLVRIEPQGSAFDPSASAAGGSEKVDKDACKVSLTFNSPQTASNDATVSQHMSGFDDEDEEESQIGAAAAGTSTLAQQTQVAASLNALPGINGVAHVTVYKKLIGFDSRTERDDFIDLLSSVKSTMATQLVTTGFGPAVSIKGNAAVLLFLEIDQSRAGVISVEQARRGLQKVIESEVDPESAAAAQAATAGGMHPLVMQVTSHLNSCTLSRFVILYARLLNALNAPSTPLVASSGSGGSAAAAFKSSASMGSTDSSLAEYIPVQIPQPPPLLDGEVEMVAQARSWLVVGGGQAPQSALHANQKLSNAAPPDGSSGGAGSYTPGSSGQFPAAQPSVNPAAGASWGISSALFAATNALGLTTAGAGEASGPAAADAYAVPAFSSRQRGCFFLTNYRLMFAPYTAASSESDSTGQRHAPFVEMHLGTLERVELTNHESFAGLTLAFYSKDFRVLTLGFDAASQWIEGLHKHVFSVAFSRDQTRSFAFAHKHDSTTAREDDGWNLYDPLAEYARVGLVDEGGGEVAGRGFRVSFANVAYTLAKSYPRMLCVPCSVDDEELAIVAKYRSSGRLPAVVWRHPLTGASLSRCSQPLAGMRGKQCSEDQSLIEGIRRANPLQSNAIYLMDARPLKAALGNALMGKGYESASHYEGISIAFLGIDNIHAIRNSHLRLVELLAGSTSASQNDAQEFHPKLAATGWLGFVKLILASSVRICRVMAEESVSVVVHCSDGWDRTSQLCSLVQLMLDPFYRSKRGFAVLVEGSWLAFGHQFALRHGHASSDYTNEQRAPIFLQWLDCVWQLLRQFANAFEFNESYLLFVAEHLYSCRFGTFLFNNEAERREANLQSKTVSIWTHLCAPRHAHLFSNPCYTPVSGPLYPSTSMKRLAVWEGLHMRHDPENKSLRVGLAFAPAASQALQRYQQLRAKLAALGLNLAELDPELPQGSPQPSPQPSPPQTPSAAASAVAAATMTTMPPTSVPEKNAAASQQQQQQPSPPPPRVNATPPPPPSAAAASASAATSASVSPAPAPTKQPPPPPPAQPAASAASPVAAAPTAVPSPAAGAVESSPAAASASSTPASPPVATTPAATTVSAPNHAPPPPPTTAAAAASPPHRDPGAALLAACFAGPKHGAPLPPFSTTHSHASATHSPAAAAEAPPTRAVPSRPAPISSAAAATKTPPASGADKPAAAAPSWVKQPSPAAPASPAPASPAVATVPAAHSHLRHVSSPSNGTTTPPAGVAARSPAASPAATSPKPASSPSSAAADSACAGFEPHAFKKDCCCSCGRGAAAHGGAKGNASAAASVGNVSVAAGLKTFGGSSSPAATSASPSSARTPTPASATSPSSSSAACSLFKDHAWKKDVCGNCQKSKAEHK